MEDPVYLDDDQVLRRMLNSEMKQSLASAPTNFQRHFTNDDRKELLIWMRDVCQAEECQADVFPLSVSIVDRFLTFVNTKRTQLQLLGAVALLLSTKLRETQQISARQLIYYTQDSITLPELKTWELFVLTTLKWDLALVTPVDFLDILIKRQLKLAQMNQTDEHIISDIEDEAQKMIAEWCLDPEYNLYPPSVIASDCLEKALENEAERSRAAAAVAEEAIEESFYTFSKIAAPHDTCFEHPSRSGPYQTYTFSQNQNKSSVDFLSPTTTLNTPPHPAFKYQHQLLSLQHSPAGSDMIQFGAYNNDCMNLMRGAQSASEQQVI